MLVNDAIGVPWISKMAPGLIVIVCGPSASTGRVKTAVLPSRRLGGVAVESGTPSINRSEFSMLNGEMKSLNCTVSVAGEAGSRCPSLGVVATARNGEASPWRTVTFKTYSPSVSCSPKTLTT